MFTFGSGTCILEEWIPFAPDYDSDYGRERKRRRREIERVPQLRDHINEKTR